jgi:hypothetical protein
MAIPFWHRIPTAPKTGQHCLIRLKPLIGYKVFEVFVKPGIHQTCGVER